MFLNIGLRSVQDSERRKANQVNSSDVTTCPQFWTTAQGAGFPEFLLELRGRGQGSGRPRRGIGWNELRRRTAFESSPPVLSLWLKTALCMHRTNSPRSRREPLLESVSFTISGAHTVPTSQVERPCCINRACRKELRKVML
uniref:Uncharacterized protein n=1 Tax=Pipistrellus kuhlii TaxID=59472 RepID=A0A7J7XVC8_PIPKU|nr:hypothetical protein mPipKuh1_010459 [Pipistrellus kuhlii]